MPTASDELFPPPVSLKPRNSMAFVSLALGILSFLGGITALPGIFCGLLGLNKSKNTGTGQAYAVAGIISSLAGIPIGLWVGSLWLHKYFPADKPDEDAEYRVQSTNNLNKIGIGLRNYDGQYGALPLGAMCDEEGTPLLSWRVAILPYLDQRELYDKFNLDEPWDSPQNKPLIAQMPAFYANPKNPNDQSRGVTPYKVFFGEHAIFSHTLQMDGNPNDPENLNRWSVNSLLSSPRGLANVVLVIEAGDPVTWTKPDDLDYTEKGPLPNLKPLYPDEVFALMGDGRVVSTRPKNPTFEAALRASIDPDGTSPFMIDQ